MESEIQWPLLLVTPLHSFTWVLVEEHSVSLTVYSTVSTAYD